MALLLAVLPAIWGTCPSWFTGVSCCAGSARSASPTAARCPCCARSESGTQGTRSGRDDHRRNGSDGCPVLEVRNGATVAPETVELPDAERLVWGLSSGLAALPTLLEGGAAAAPVATGPPPRPEPVCERLVGTLQLLV